MTLNKDTPNEKELKRLIIDDWTGKGFKEVNSFELLDKDRAFQFMGNNHIIYIKRGERKLLENTDKLWISNITDGSQKPFYGHTTAQSFRK